MSTVELPKVVVERNGSITLVRINRPASANALDPETSELLGVAFTEAERDDNVRVVILTGTGDRVFCAGMDLKAFSRGERRSDDRPSTRVFVGRSYPKPIIAAVNGTAAAGGFELVLAADLVVAADHARFGIPEVKRGLVAAGGGVTLPKRIPLAIALEFGLTGDMIDARRAFELGLVNRVVPGAEVLDVAFDLARRVEANGPLAVAMTKRLMWTEAGRTNWTELADAATSAFESNDAREGARAFAEKRPPQWTGS